MDVLQRGSGNLTSAPRWISPAKCAAMARADCRLPHQQSDLDVPVFRFPEIGFRCRV
jgi:hypothetical protein